MTAEFVDLKKYMSVREAFARIRKIGEDKETIYVCYVTSAKRKLEGVVTVKDLLLSDDDVILEATQVALASFMPMLMGTGGNSGSQSSTAIIRSLSLGDTSPSDALRVIWKELRVAFLCGVSLAAANFIKMLLVDRLLLGNTAVTMPVAATVCCTIVFVVMFAKAVGSLLPMIAEKIGVDPAVMASPLISTITDAVSLLI